MPPNRPMGIFDSMKSMWARDLVLAVLVLAMHADPEGAAHGAGRITDRHHDGAVHARLARAGTDVAGGIDLDVAARDRRVALGCEARHALADGHAAHDLDHGRRQADLGFEDQGVAV